MSKALTEAERSRIMRDVQDPTAWEEDPAPKKAKRTKKKTNTDALLLCVLDRSGSMNEIADATVEGFNGFIAEQKAIPGKTLVSLLLFDNEFETPLVAVDADEVPEMKVRKGPLAFSPRNSTALRDAIGIAVTGGEQWVKDNAWKGRVFLWVNTDGKENSSTRWSASDIRQMVERKQGDGWDVIFAGAGDSFLQAQDFSIPVANTSGYTADYHGTRSVYAGTSNNVSTSRLAGVSYTDAATGNV